MPNHCESDLYVYGPKAIVEEIIKKHFDAEDGRLLCDSVIPYPAIYKEMDAISAKWDEQAKNDEPLDWKNRPKDGFNSGGYEWCCNNWGTKWGTYHGTGLRRTTRGFSTGFQSAWSPPIPVVSKLAEMYPKVKIQMNSFEMGAAYQCKANWENGELTNEHETSYRGTRGG